MPIYFEFEVSLRYVEPRIWRRFQIEKRATFADLHMAIQVGFEWENSHLWEFRTRLHRGRALAGLRMDDIWSMYKPPPNAESTMLARFFGPGKHRSCVYVYDYGDNWVHDVLFQRSLATPVRFRQRLIAGDRAGPLEDCGGVPGYQRLVEFLQTGVDPWEEDPVELKEWCGHWDPEAFDLEKARLRFLWPGRSR